MLRAFFILFALGICAVLAFAGFRGSKSTRPPIEIFPDMDHQPRFNPQHESAFFADGRSSRLPVPGTVPQGYQMKGAYLQTGASNVGGTFTTQPDYFGTGRIGDNYGDGFPIEITAKTLDRGQERYGIHCAVCHAPTGSGNGVVKQLGLVTVANLLDPRIVAQPDGQIFATITHGRNTMGAYGPQISVEDRWAIIAYLRALQKAGAGKLANLSEAAQKELQATK